MPTSALLFIYSLIKFLYACKRLNVAINKQKFSQLFSVKDVRKNNSSLLPIKPVNIVASMRFRILIMTRKILFIQMQNFSHINTFEKFFVSLLLARSVKKVFFFLCPWTWSWQSHMRVGKFKTYANLWRHLHTLFDLE